MPVDIRSVINNVGADVIQLSILLGERMRQELPDAIKPLTSARTRVYSAGRRSVAQSTSSRP